MGKGTSCDRHDHEPSLERELNSQYDGRSSQEGDSFMLNWFRGFILIGIGLVGVFGTLPANAMTIIPHFAVSTLLLPNGVLLSTQPGSQMQSKWKDIEVSLQLLGVPSQYPYGQSVVGNHSQIIHQSLIKTPNGKAWFALNKRTPPAASHSTKVTEEYWLAIERTSMTTGYNVDYCIEAAVVGNLQKAKHEVLQLVGNWTVPPKANQLKSYIEAPSMAQPGRTVWVYGWLKSSNKKPEPMNIELYRKKEPNSGLIYDSTLQSSGIYSKSISIPAQLPYGDYQLLVYNAASGNHPVLQKEIYIAPMDNTQKPPEKIPALNVWADPPFVGTRIFVDGWVPKGIHQIMLQMIQSKKERQYNLTVQNNGYFKTMVLLPDKMKYGKTIFIIRGNRQQMILRKLVLVDKP